MRVIATCCPRGLGIPHADLSGEEHYDEFIPAFKIANVVDSALRKATQAGYDHTDKDFYLILEFRKEQA